MRQANVGWSGSFLGLGVEHIEEDYCYQMNFEPTLVKADILAVPQVVLASARGRLSSHVDLMERLSMY